MNLGPTQICHCPNQQARHGLKFTVQNHSQAGLRSLVQPIPDSAFYQDQAIIGCSDPSPWSMLDSNLN